MSKTFNNYIGLAELPAKMFGSTMSIPDNVMGKYFELLTDVAPEEVSSFSPRDQKIKLAWEIVCFYHGRKAADKAKDEFIGIFSEGKTPTQIKTIKITPAQSEPKSYWLNAI